MFTLRTLHSYENGHTVEDILCSYFGVRPSRLMHTLTEDDNGEIEYWADILHIGIGELLNWIEACLKKPANFKVVKEVGSGGGYPDCELDLDGGVVLNFSWVTDD
jgi:hypothetical protein